MTALHCENHETWNTMSGTWSCDSDDLPPCSRSRQTRPSATICSGRQNSVSRNQLSLCAARMQASCPRRRAGRLLFRVTGTWISSEGNETRRLRGRWTSLRYAGDPLWCCSVDTDSSDKWTRTLRGKGNSGREGEWNTETEGQIAKG
jgi:hypothetical protein